MTVTYFKRFRMELDLDQVALVEPQLPPRYEWQAWDPTLLDRHAVVKFSSFRSEIDANVFPCLGEAAGCRRLMQEISRRENFLPRSTWLISRGLPDGSITEDCGTIQGIVLHGWLGAIQNVGVAPDHRGLGLGRALVLKSLLGFRAAGVTRVFLEVTAKNTVAVQLYRSIGFRLAKTTYKTVDLEPATNSIS